MGYWRRVIIVKKLLVVDGHNLAFRAFFAIPPLSTRSGQPTNALYGFISMLLKAVTDEKPDHIFVAFDLPAPTFRHKRFEGYKAHREKAPDEFRQQIPLIKEFVNRLGLPIIEKEGFEADDVIGTLAKQAEKQHPPAQSFILTGDRDTLQLVNPHTFLLVPKKGIADMLLVTPENIQKEFGLTADQVVDFKSLKGDSSDNIPGVTGIGDKTAMKLLAEFGTLEHLYDHLDQVASLSLREKLARDKDQAFMSKELATIHCEVPLEFDFREQPWHIDQVLPFLEHYDLTTLQKKLMSFEGRSTRPLAEIPPPAAPTVRVTLISSSASFGDMMDALKSTDRVACYPLYQESLVGLALSWEKNQAVYIPLTYMNGNSGLKKTSELGPMFDRFEAPEPFDFSPLFKVNNLRWITHDSKRLLKILLAHNVTLASPPDDTMLMDYLLNPDRVSHSLDKCLKDYLHQDLPDQKTLLAANKVATLADLTPDILLPVAGAYAEGILALYDYYYEALHKEALLAVYHTVDLPLTPVLCDMEQVGIKLDLNYLKELSTEFHHRVKIMEQQIYTLAGETFNLNSPKQLSVILFEKLGLPPIRKIQSGYSTDADVLEELATQHDIARQILEYRQLTKLLNTYIDVLPTMVDKESRLHTSFNLTVAATGRLSSSEPNLQNIPIRTPDGEKIRKAFIAKPGYTLVIADYSQIELRVLAHITKDERLIQAFLSNEDIHASTAAAIFSVPYSDVTQAMRRKAKEINFGIAYGMRAFGLAQRLGIGQKEAADYIHLYFEKYPRIKAYLDECIEFVKENGYVETLFGRKRFFKNYRHLGKKEQSALDRMIVNAPMQGTAADIIKLAMLAVSEALRPLKAKMVLQIHDELIIETPENEVDTVKHLLTSAMEKAVDLQVPLTVNIGVGSNWLEAK